MEDVTVPDDTHMDAGQSFTKTWKFKNTGTCPWVGYKLVFALGNQMGAPDSAPVPQTLPGDTVDISVDLVAPAADGNYAAYFTLHTDKDQYVPIGLEKTFWVKIIVGKGSPPTAAPTSGSSSGGGNAGGGTINCKFSENGNYVSQLLSLINSARSAAKLPAVSVNYALTAAARDHSVDMACNNFLGHTGSNGSSIGRRIAAAGYAASYYEEIIAIGTPEDAMSQWRNSADHWNVVLDPKVTEVGIGYVYYSNSDYGGYFTADFANPQQ